MSLDADIPGYAEVAPDLVVEVSSPNDSLSELHDKALMWLRFGVRQVWVAHPETRTVGVYRPDGSVLNLCERDNLDGGDVLPGFGCPVRDIF